jgi:hypothetical protein
VTLKDVADELEAEWYAAPQLKDFHNADKDTKTERDEDEG